ncbi:hypothetical protein TIFTF001_034031 [Ficus carica]|uniref:Leucine-rich repeat-containing N-terminal plant-type domain-containing protein n=1 Tax=Ficus carica TaxID=3494 RepID=A0AA88E1Z1_FICCA|nr:hypothetical protein TIFTF001_034031 [Ficus carica]
MMVWFLPWLSLLLLLLPSPFYTSSFSSPPFAPPPLCHPHESSALLHFRNSFPIVNYTSLSSYCASEFEIANPNTTMTWNMSRDCCTWNGVTCDEVSGHVIGLDLFCSGLDGVIHSNNSLFFLIHLQSLVLSHNQLDGSEISPQFGWFSSMIHLDLSDSGFTGHLPLELSFLSSLVTLDLSDLTLETLSLKKILANLTSLRELSLIGVTGSYFSTDSFMNLSISLLSLDLSESGLIGKFPENIFHLPNLQELRLSYIRNLTGSFPRHNWTSPLRELGLPNTGFLIDLPYLLRNLKHLTHLDASDCGLTGSLTLSGNNTQITSLDLSSNNFGGQFPWDFLNLEKLSILNLYFNKFEGQLPEICRNSTKKNFLCDSSKNVESVGPLPLNLKFLFLSDLEEDGIVEQEPAQEGGEGQISKLRKTESHWKFGRVSRKVHAVDDQEQLILRRTERRGS